MTDRFTVRAIALGLIFLALGVVAALVIVLVWVDLTAEQTGTLLGTLGALGTTAVGATAGLLAHTASEPPVPIPVPVIPVDPEDGGLEPAQPAE